MWARGQKVGESNSPGLSTSILTEEENQQCLRKRLTAILQWALSSVTRVWWGKGKVTGSSVPVLEHHRIDHQLLAMYTYTKVDLCFQWYQHKPPFDSEDKRRQLLAKLNAIEGISLPKDAITRRPSIALGTLRDESVLQQFLQVFDWVVEEIRLT